MHIYTTYPAYVIQAMPTGGKTALARLHPDLFVDLESADIPGQDRTARQQAREDLIRRASTDRVIVTSSDIYGPHVNHLAFFVMSADLGLTRWAMRRDGDTPEKKDVKQPSVSWWAWCPDQPTYHPTDLIRPAWCRPRSTSEFLSDTKIVNRLLEIHRQGWSVGRFLRTETSLVSGVADLSKYNQWEGIHE